MFNSKCKFIKHCNHYSKDSYVCNKDSGNAYGFGIEFRPGGCYRNLEEKGKESIYWKQ
jgi:hypothetical protein